MASKIFLLILNIFAETAQNLCYKMTIIIMWSSNRLILNVISVYVAYNNKFPKNTEIQFENRELKKEPKMMT